MKQSEFDAAVAAVSDPLERVRVAHALRPMLVQEFGPSDVAQLAEKNLREHASMPADFKDPLGRDARHWAGMGFGGL